MSTTVPPPASVGERDEQPGAVHQRARGQQRRGPLARPGRGERIGRLGRSGCGRSPRARRRGRRCATSRPSACRWCRRCRGRSGRRPTGVRGAPLPRPAPTRPAPARRARPPRAGADARRRASRAAAWAATSAKAGSCTSGLGVGVVEQVVELVGDVPEVHVHRDAAELQRGVEGLEVLGAVRDVDRDPVAGLAARPPSAGATPAGAARSAKPAQVTRRSPHTTASRSGTIAAMPSHTAAKFQSDTCAMLTAVVQPHLRRIGHDPRVGTADRGECRATGQRPTGRSREARGQRGPVRRARGRAGARPELARHGHPALPMVAAPPTVAATRDPGLTDDAARVPR